MPLNMEFSNIVLDLYYSKKEVFWINLTRINVLWFYQVNEIFCMKLS